MRGSGDIKLLISWLNDAYAMEQAQLKALKRYIQDYEAYPDIQGQLEAHIEETEQQLEDMQTCIDHVGGKVSTVKSWLGSITGTVQGLETAPFKDETVKNMLMLHAAEHFEHACYVALGEGARALGQVEIAEVCDRIADEERRTADWALGHLPKLVQATVTNGKPDQP